MNSIVLLVDDNVLPMVYYVRALEQAGFEVKHCQGPDDALAFAGNNSDRIVAIVLDIMMPPGEKYKNKNTDEGLRTGVLLHRDLLAVCPDVPIVVLTNVANPETISEFKESPRLKVVQKMNYPPFELSDLVSELVESARKDSPGRVSER